LQKIEDGYADISFWNSDIAVVDIEYVNAQKLKAATMEKAAAFVVYHELAHLMTSLGHRNGLLADEGGVYTILGTRVGGPVARYQNYWNIYDTLEKLITDPDNRYEESDRNLSITICEKLNENN
jgi:hypothetical protein